MSLSSDAKPAVGPWGDVSETIGRYVSLLKIRPMSAVIYSAIVGLIAAQGDLSIAHSIVAIACIAIGGGGSAALNMWYEADLDAKMRRTSRRVLPSGKLMENRALLFGAVLCTGSVLIMGSVINWVAAGVLSATILAYFGLYTVILKRRSWLNVLIGGSLAGVLTPLSGWAAAQGEISAAALWLFAFVLFWTPPHVWSQAIYRVDDYARAGVPMLPATAGIAVTQRWILVLTGIQVAVSLLPYFAGASGLLHLFAAIAAGAALMLKAVYLFRCVDRGEVLREARSFFRQSIWYVVVVLTALALDRALFIA